MMRLPRRLRVEVSRTVGSLLDLPFAQVIGEREQGEAGEERLEAEEVRKRKHSEPEVEDGPYAEKNGDDSAGNQPPAAMRFAEAQAGGNTRAAGDYCPNGEQN